MTELEEERPERKRSRRCDFCGSATAVLFCRPDSANLCLACDREVHSTNPLFTKHIRSLLCDACDSSPATIFCCTHSSVFCQNCDWESHSLSLSPAHLRRPLDGFTGCPSVTELLALFGFQDVGKKPLLDDDPYVSVGDDDDDGISDYLVWDTPAVVNLDDLIAPSDSKPNFQSIGVPPLPKNRNAACGQHKEEILSQLREMSKLEPNHKEEPEFQTMENGLFGERASRFKQNMESDSSCFRWYNDVGDFADQGFVPTLLNGFDEANPSLPDEKESGSEQLFATLLQGFGEEKCSLPDLGVAIVANNCNEGHRSSNTETFQVVPRVAPREINSRDRESAISRYKEKKKTRRYEKQIRYESRKARAEARIRIKGRFAKMDR